MAVTSREGERRGGGTRVNVEGDKIRWEDLTESRRGNDPLLVSDMDRVFQGMEGVVTDFTAAAQAIKDASSELQTVAERHQRMYGTRTQPGDVSEGPTREEVTRDFRAAIEEESQAMREEIRTARQEVMTSEREEQQEVIQQERAERRVAEAAAPPEQPEPPEPPERTREMAEPSERPQREPEAGRGIPEAPSGEAEFQRYRQYFQGEFDPARGKPGLSLANLRTDLGRRAQERFGNITLGEQLVWDEELGDFVYPPTEEDAGVAGAAARVAPLGVQAAFLRREKIAGGLRGGMQTLAEGGSLREAGTTGLVRAGLGKAVGLTGAAAFAIDAIADFAVEQREQNAEWQRIMGGTNIEGALERGRQQAFGFGQFGRMDAGRAEQLFRAVSEQGLTGQDRQRALDFAIQGYMDLGQSIQQSMEVVQTASRTGQEALLGVGDALEGVTEAASAAGLNTEQMRQQFIGLWQGFSQTLPGPQATAAAQVLTEVQTGLGREFQDVGMAGLAAPENIAVLAGRAGMTRGEYLAQINTPEGRISFIEDAQRLVEERAALGVTTRGVEIAERFIATEPPQGPDGAYTDEQAEVLAQELRATADPVVLRQLMESIGITGLTDANVYKFYAQVQLGNFNPAELAQEQVEEQRIREFEPPGGMERGTRMGLGGPFTPGGGERQELPEGTFRGTAGTFQRGGPERQELPEGTFRGVGGTFQRGGPRERPEGPVSVTGAPLRAEESEEMASLRERVEEEYRSGFAGVLGPLTDRQVRGVGRAFMEDVERTGRAGGISEQIATNRGLAEGIKMVEVDTLDEEGNPTTRVVTLAAAMEYFRDQIDAGTARIAEGIDAGKELAELTGAVAPREGAPASATSEELAEQVSEEGIGFTPEEWKIEGEERQEAGGTVVFSATDELKRLIRPEVTSGNVTFDEDWVPSNPHVTPNQRPTGNP